MGSEVTMRPDDVREAMHAAPFKPFLLCLADGRRVEIPHPDFISLSPSGRTAFVWGRDNRHHFIDVALVLSIETAAESSSQTAP
jgi:hypothetical protein